MGNSNKRTTVNTFSEQWFRDKGYVKNSQGGFDPPPFRHKVFNEEPKEVVINNQSSLNIGGNLLMSFVIDPIGKPRMTQSDKWKKRKTVVNYFKYKDELIRQAADKGFVIPSDSFHMVFVMPVPHSISEKEKSKRIGSAHQQKPDIDNLEKAIFDSLCKEDSYIWDCRVTKLWGAYGQILIYKI